MNKKIVIVITIAVFILISGTVLAISFGKKGKEPIIQAYQKDFYTEYFENRNNENSSIYEENEIIYESDCFGLGVNSDTYLNCSFRPNSLERLVSMFPNPNVREESDHFYLFYDTDTGVRIFIFFSLNDNIPFSYGYPIIMTKKLKYSDFEKIKIGDSLEDINNLDPIADYYVKEFDKLSDAIIEKLSTDEEGLVTVHLLEDGILKIAYERSAESQYIINDIDYSTKFEIYSIGQTRSYKISKDDYPNN